MDENEVGGGGYGGDLGDHFHRNEAISAVVDEGFLGEEDDDYEDLYNDVNVGENFMQSFRRNEDDAGQKNEEVQESRENLGPPPPQVLPLADTGGGGALVGEGASYTGREEGYQIVGLKNNSNADVGVVRGAGPPGGGAFTVEMGQSGGKPPESEDTIVNANNRPIVHQLQPYTANVGNYETARNMENVNGAVGNIYGVDGMGGGFGGAADGAMGTGGTFLFVGDLHWWTTDADLESELCKYGVIKELKFYDERASGKSKGYCHVEFYDPAAAAACKEGMNGHLFNGRPCNVQYATLYTIKRLGDAQASRNQQQMGSQLGPTTVNQPRRGPGDFPGKPGGILGTAPSGGNNQGNGDNNGRAFSRGNWGRGNPHGGMANRGPMGQMRNRAGGMGGRGLAGNGFGQGIGSGPPMMHPQAMMGQGFDPSFGGPMGRMAGYGAFPGAPGAPFPGMFGPVGNVGMPGVAPHVNPAFFGRGMSLGGMGMMPNPGVEGSNMGMWQDPNFGGWGRDEQGGRAGESSYGEEAASERQYGEGSQDRGPWPGNTKEKDKGSERDWSGSSEKRLRDERGAGYEKDVNREKDLGRDRDWSDRRSRDEKDIGRDRERERERERSQDRGYDRERERGRERHRDDRDRYNDHHRHHSRDAKYDDERDRGRASSRTHGKSRSSHEEEQRSMSKDADYAKRRR